GGKVKLGYAAGDGYQGSNFHNVDFTGPQPTSCTSGVPRTQPMPPGWSGECEFDAPGTYTFRCDLHQSMTGTITVAAAATPTPEATPTPTATPPPAGGSPPPGGDPVTQTTLKGAVALARSQKGTRVRGSVNVKVAGSRLEVAAWAPRKTLAHSRSS